MRPDKKIKILICGILPPPNFGHSVVYQMLMKTSFPKTFDVKFLNMNFWSYQAHGKVTGGKIFKFIRFWFQYLYLLISFRPRYVLYNSSFYRMPFLKDFIFCMTGVLLGSRVVFHDLGQYVRELHDSLNGIGRWMLRLMLRTSCASIVMGENVRGAYEGLMDQGKIFAVPGTVDDSAALSCPVVKKSGITVLYFSHLSRFKGIEVALAAAEKVLQSQGEIHFVFGGPMENEGIAARLQALEKKYPQRVSYVGYIEDELKRTALFRQADIFIFPTLRDVFGLVLLHAMAEGLPVIASKEGTVPEIIQEGSNGFLIPKGDEAALAQKIMVLAADKALRDKMSQANRRRYLDVYAPARYERYMEDVFISLEKLC